MSAREWFTPEHLGRMTDEQLDEIRCCRRCLERYEVCRCGEGVARRRAESSQEPSDA